LIFESTWAIPIIGALHVLAIALFAGTVIVPDKQLRRWRFMGLAILLITGALLFWSQPTRVYNSLFFRIKMGLLLLLVASPKFPRIVTLALWIAVIVAARGIAYL
jgi:hypothetical protein